jgi:SAM-dependent methyltransferase
MSPVNYYAAAVLDRASSLTPVARLRERLMAAGAREPEGLAPDGLPLPPARMRVLVVDSAAPEAFMRGSEEAATLIRRALDDAGVELAGAVLDFGCGCGRVARRWAALGLDLHACDYNPDLVEWCGQNLPFLEARVNALEAPAPYPDGRFDLVYAISILTHLTEPVALAWMADWRRILKPGGHLLFTTHGDAFRDQLGRRMGPRYDAGEMVVKGGRIQGLNACVAHHPPRYVRERLLDGFELLGFRAAPSPMFAQDVWLARRT